MTQPVRFLPEAKDEYDAATYRLNLLAATFFPVATLSAVFGMNLPHGLESLGVPLSFWGVLGVGLVCGLILARVIARKPAPLVRPVTRRVVKKR